jgi:DNA modification methylase
LKENQIICGNTIKKLQKIPDNKIDLVYLDPPFFTERNFESFDDKWDSLDQYLNFMIDVLSQCHRVLKKTGSLYLHCDMHASHYLKIELDKIFGRKKFQNEVVWKRHNAHNDTKQGSKMFGRIHDTIFHFTKSNSFTWNTMYDPYPEEYIKKYYKYVEPETDRRYALGDVSGPGGASKGNPRYSFLGITRYYRFSKKRMMQMYRDGKIVQRAKGTVPLQKRYLDEMPGIMLQDIWNDIKSVQVTKKEDTGYSTQKPLKLLERIIQISSNEKDLVLDPMCGSGTTLVASQNLGRKFIGIDSSKEACQIARKRVKERSISEIEMIEPVLLP